MQPHALHQASSPAISRQVSDVHTLLPCIRQDHQCTASAVQASDWAAGADTAWGALLQAATASRQVLTGTDTLQVAALMRQTLLSLLAARQQGRADLLFDVFSQGEECLRADVGQVSILPKSSDLQQVGRCPTSRVGKLWVPLWQHASSMCVCVMSMCCVYLGRQEVCILCTKHIICLVDFCTGTTPQATMELGSWLSGSPSCIMQARPVTCMFTRRPVQTASRASLYQDVTALVQVLAKDVMTSEDRASDTFALAVLQALRGALEAGSACSAQAAGTLLAQLHPSQRALVALRRLLQVCGRRHVVSFRLQKRLQQQSAGKPRCSSSVGAAELTARSAAAHHQQPAMLWDVVHCSLPARHLACRRWETICWTLSLRLASLILSLSVKTPARQDLMTLVSPSARQAGTLLGPACALLHVECVAGEAQTSALLCKQCCTSA